MKTALMITLLAGCIWGGGCEDRVDRAKELRATLHQPQKTVWTLGDIASLRERQTWLYWTDADNIVTQLYDRTMADRWSTGLKVGSPSYLASIEWLENLPTDNVDPDAIEAVQIIIRVLSMYTTSEIAPLDEVFQGAREGFTEGLAAAVDGDLITPLVENAKVGMAGQDAKRQLEDEINDLGIKLMMKSAHTGLIFGKIEIPMVQ